MKQWGIARGCEMGNIDGKPTLRGNTIRVYLYVLRNGPCELRDVQHALKLSTPSLAFYHLSRLADAGVVNRTEDGRYVVVTDISADLLDGYVKFGRRIIPQLFFLTLIFTGILAYYVSLVWKLPLDTDDAVTIVYSLSIILLWYETIKVWRRLSS
jgi:DNA-binding transcriptional ArsR family regulator